MRKATISGMNHPTHVVCLLAHHWKEVNLDFESAHRNLSTSHMASYASIQFKFIGSELREISSAFEVQFSPLFLQLSEIAAKRVCVNENFTE